MKYFHSFPNALEQKNETKASIYSVSQFSCQHRQLPQNYTRPENQIIISYENDKTKHLSMPLLQRQVLQLMVLQILQIEKEEMKLEKVSQVCKDALLKPL